MSKPKRMKPVKAWGLFVKDGRVSFGKPAGAFIRAYYNRQYARDIASGLGCRIARVEVRECSK